MSGKIVQQVLKVLLFLGFGSGILYLLYRSQQKAYQEECMLNNIPLEDCSLLQKVIDDFTGANYWWVLTVLIAFMLSNVSRAIRWKMLMKPLGYEPKLINCFWAVMMGYFANLGLPRMGEVVKAGVITQYEKIELEKVMGTVVVERMTDVISILIMTSLSLLLAFNKIWPFFSANMNLEEKLSNAGPLLIGLLLVFMILGGLAYVNRKRIVNSALGQRVIRILEGFLDGLKSVSQLERPWAFVFHSVVIWLMYYSMIFFCFFSFVPTQHLGLTAGLVVFVFGAWGMVIPSPGGMGTYHFMVQTALSIYGISESDSFSFANIAFFSIQIGCNIFFGLLALLLLPIINRNYTPQKVTV